MEQTHGLRERMLEEQIELTRWSGMRYANRLEEEWISRSQGVSQFAVYKSIMIQKIIDSHAESQSQAWDQMGVEVVGMLLELGRAMKLLSYYLGIMLKIIRISVYENWGMCIWLQASEKAQIIRGAYIMYVQRWYCNKNRVSDLCECGLNRSVFRHSSKWFWNNYEASYRIGIFESKCTQRLLVVLSHTCQCKSVLTRITAFRPDGGFQPYSQCVFIRRKQTRWNKCERKWLDLSVQSATLKRPQGRSPQEFWE